MEIKVFISIGLQSCIVANVILNPINVLIMKNQIKVKGIAD